MIRFLNYYGRFQGMKGSVVGLPIVARTILFIAALPGLVLLGLSIVVFLVSLLTLLLLTVPVYRLLSALFLPGHHVQKGMWTEPELLNPMSPGPTGRRHVDVKIVE